MTETIYMTTIIRATEGGGIRHVTEFAGIENLRRYVERITAFAEINAKQPDTIEELLIYLEDYGPGHRQRHHRQSTREEAIYHISNLGAQDHTSIFD